MLRDRIKNYLSCYSYAWLIWFVASLFYGLEYFQRVSPAVMAKPLMATFHIDATTLGFIISFYFYAYAAAQIPVGILIDKYGARLLLTLSCLVISVGTLLFAVAKLLWLLAIARLLIGFGSAFAFIGVLKLASQWYSADRFAFMVGLTNTLGIVGAIFGEAPLARLESTLGWSQSFILIALFGFLVSWLLWVIIQDKPGKDCRELAEQTTQTSDSDSIKAGLKLIFSNGQTWLTGLYAGLMVAPIIAFAELWAVPFFMKDFHLTSVLAANLNMAVFIGIGVGGPVIGWLSGYFQRQKSIMLLGNLMALLSLSAIIYIHLLNYWLAFLLLFIFGFSTSSMLLSFSINKNRYALSHSGLVTAFTNMLIMTLGAIYQPLIGKLLDWFLADKLSEYSLADFHHALIVLPMTSVVCLILLAFIRKSQHVN